MTDATAKNFIDLTASIVSAYLSNNPTPAAEIPGLISQIHAALVRVSSGRSEAPLEPAKPAVSIKKSISPDYLVCLEDGKTLQVAEASSAHPVQHDAGAISRQMGPAARLSHGGAELCGGALAARQGNGIGPAAPPASATSRSRTCMDSEKIAFSVSAAIASASRASRLDALDHRAQAVGALRRQMLAETELVEHGERIGCQDFLWRAAGIKRQHDRDQAAHDMGVAVAAILERRLAVRL